MPALTIEKSAKSVVNSKEELANACQREELRAYMASNGSIPIVNAKLSVCRSSVLPGDVAVYPGSQVNVHWQGVWYEGAVIKLGPHSANLCRVRPSSPRLCLARCYIL